MITLYWFWSFNPQKARLALEELGLQYSLVTVDLGRGGQHADLVGELNPNHKVPILSWGPYTLWESNAIVTYLGEREHRLWPTDAEGKGRAAKWLFFEARHLSEPIGELWFNGYVARLMGRTPDTLAAENAAKKSARYLSVLDEHLAKDPWVLGSEFSLVDCCYGPVLDALALAGDYIEAYPALKAYLKNIRERKSWRACEFRS
ncbi:MAG: glutathione S-transferase family protein [Gammaproteobacteria bacterium]|nr:glutathione S-transferase family protein [Gammaproteobacteria bacterium]